MQSSFLFILPVALFSAACIYYWFPLVADPHALPKTFLNHYEGTLTPKGNRQMRVGGVFLGDIWCKPVLDTTFDWGYQQFVLGVVGLVMLVLASFKGRKKALMSIVGLAFINFIVLATAVSSSELAQAFTGPILLFYVMTILFAFPFLTLTGGRREPSIELPRNYSFFDGFEVLHFMVTFILGSFTLLGPKLFASKIYMADSCHLSSVLTNLQSAFYFSLAFLSAVSVGVGQPDWRRYRALSMVVAYLLLFVKDLYNLMAYSQLFRPFILEGFMGLELIWLIFFSFALSRTLFTKSASVPKGEKEKTADKKKSQ